MASVPFTCCPVAATPRLTLVVPPPSVVPVTLFSIGVAVDSSVVAAVLGSRGFAVGSAAARVCHQHLHPGFGMVAPNLFDDAKWRSWLTGCFCSTGSLTTLVSVLGRDGLRRPRFAHVDGAILEGARWRKERHYPELLANKVARASLSLLRKWEADGLKCGFWCLAKAKVRHEPKVMRVSAQYPWVRRWRCMPPKLSPCHCWNVELVSNHIRCGW